MKRMLIGIAIVLMVIVPSIFAQAEEGGQYVPVHVEDVLMIDGYSPAVLLVDQTKENHLLIFVDQSQAMAIAMGVMSLAFERPLTHDLIGILIGRLGAKITKVTIRSLKENTFYAWITLQNAEGQELEIDARPSDAIAIAVRVDAPIYAARDLMEEGAGPKPDEEGSDPGIESETVPGEPKHGA